MGLKKQRKTQRTQRNDHSPIASYPMLFAEIGGGPVVSEHANSLGRASDPLYSCQNLTDFHHEQDVIVHDCTGEDEAVYSVEDTSVARHQAARVLCPRPALEQGF